MNTIIIYTVILVLNSHFYYVQIINEILVKKTYRIYFNGLKSNILWLFLVSFQLDAFSLPEVNAQLKETCKRLKEAVLQLVELTQQRDALIEEIKCK